MKAIASMIWGVIPDKRQVIMTVLIVCLVLSALGGVLIGVDVPFKSKTTAELYLDNHYENWRLHANGTKLHRLDDEGDILQRNCDKLESQIADLYILSLRIKIIPGVSQEDIFKSERAISELKKTLVVAQIALTENGRLFKETYAMR